MNVYRFSCIRTVNGRSYDRKGLFVAATEEEALAAFRPDFQLDRDVRLDSFERLELAAARARQKLTDEDLKILGLKDA